MLRPYVLASCGFCSECLNARIASIIFRAHVVNLHSIAFIDGFDIQGSRETEDYTLPHNRMITLTISPDHLNGRPEPHQYIRKFRDTWRKKYPFPFPRHLIVPEYGMDRNYTQRLHFHGLFFDIPGCSLQSGFDCWTFGKVDISKYFTQGAVFYATKYLSKSMGADYDHVRSPFMPRHYKLRPYISQGFGSELFEDYPDAMSFARDVPLELEIGGTRIPLPPYYDQFLTNPAHKWILLKRRLRALKEVVVKEQLFDPSDLEGILKAKENNFGRRPVPYKGIDPRLAFENPEIVTYE